MNTKMKAFMQHLIVNKTRLNYICMYIYENIGDCHAVLCQNGMAVDMSDPHKPNRPDESARILEAKVSTYVIFAAYID
jgi:serine/threonine protein phosphatase PrpC